MLRGRRLIDVGSGPSILEVDRRSEDEQPNAVALSNHPWDWIPHRLGVGGFSSDVSNWRVVQPGDLDSQGCWANDCQKHPTFHGTGTGRWMSWSVQRPSHPRREREQTGRVEAGRLEGSFRPVQVRNGPHHYCNAMTMGQGLFGRVQFWGKTFPQMASNSAVIFGSLELVGFCRKDSVLVM